MVWKPGDIDVVGFINMHTLDSFRKRAILAYESSKPRKMTIVHPSSVLGSIFIDCERSDVISFALQYPAIQPRSWCSQCWCTVIYYAWVTWSRFKGEIVIERVSGRSSKGISWQIVFPLPVPAVTMESLPHRIASEASSWKMRGMIVCKLRCWKTRNARRRTIYISISRETPCCLNCWDIITNYIWNQGTMLQRDLSSQ